MGCLEPCWHRTTWAYHSPRPITSEDKTNARYFETFLKRFHCSFFCFNNEFKWKTHGNQLDMDCKLSQTRAALFVYTHRVRYVSVNFNYPGAVSSLKQLPRRPLNSLLRILAKQSTPSVFDDTSSRTMEVLLWLILFLIQVKIEF